MIHLVDNKLKDIKEEYKNIIAKAKYNNSTCKVAEDVYCGGYYLCDIETCNKVTSTYTTVGDLLISNMENFDICIDGVKMQPNIEL
mgnify:CR=1 FL=1